VISKDEIIEQVWDGRIVSDGTLNTRINAARKAVGDDGKAQAVIKTFPRRGFRWVAEVGDKISATLSDNLEIAIDKPSIAVLPFENLSNDPEQEYFSDGITEDIITAMGRFHDFFVIARNTMFTYKGQSVDVQEVAKDLGVYFILEGSVRKSGGRVRISAQLNDGETGIQMWAEQFDRELEDIFAVQDEITQTVAAAIGPEIAKLERNKIIMKRPDSLSAWEHYQRGMWHYFQTPSMESYVQARACYSKALEIDPNFAPLYAEMARADYVAIMQGWKDYPQKDLKIALDCAKKAVELDSTDSNCHSVLSCIYSVLGEHKKSIREGEIAISLNPNDHTAYRRLATAYVWSGNFEAAIPMAEMSFKLSPNDPDAGVSLARLAEAYMGLGQFELAVEKAELAATKHRRGIWLNTALIASLAHAGRLEDAKQACQELFERLPNFTCAYLVEHFPSTDPHLIAVYLDGLRKAGVPEE
jgi:TolB-like protein/Tfp pilus assembly protein PilF